MLRASAFLLLVTGSVAALCADDQPVRAPYVEPGDCWSYRTENMNYQDRPIGDYELCVTLVDTKKGVILAVATVKDDGREIDTAYSLEWSGYASVSGVITPQGTRHFRFPLNVGDTYSHEFEFRDSRLGPNAGKARYDFKVAGWEDISVPAGTFRALKVEGQGKTWRYDRPIEFLQSVTWWYSPKVNRYVKFWYYNPARSYGEELLGYRLNQ